MTREDKAREWLVHCIGCGGEHVEYLLGELEVTAAERDGWRQEAAQLHGRLASSLGLPDSDATRRLKADRDAALGCAERLRHVAQIATGAVHLDRCGKLGPGLGELAEILDDLQEGDLTGATEEET